MEHPVGFLRSLMMFLRIVPTARRSRRYLLVILIFAIGILILTSDYSSRILPLGSVVYFGLDSNWKPITAQNNRWRGYTVAGELELPEATWTCTDDHLSEQDRDTKTNRRSRQCIVENLCVDRQGTDHVGLQAMHLPSAGREEENEIEFLLSILFCV